MKPSRLLLLVLGALAALVAGCGSSSSSSGGHDPAALVPAGAPLYAEATIRPDGKVGSDLQAALKKILRTDDPGAKITQAIDDSAKRDGFSYEKDIAPWLGDKVGVALTAVHGSKADFVAVINTTDESKALDAITRAKGRYETRNYKGFDYRINLDKGIAAGVFDQAVVVGTESGFKSAVDASKGASLSESNDLRAVRAKVAEDRVGLLYLDVQGLLRLAGQASGGGAELNALLQSASAAVPKTIGAAFQAQPDVLRIDAVSLGTPRSGSSAASGADVVAGLPSDAWLALGIGKSGETIDRALQTVGSSGGLAGVGINALLSQLKQQTGLDLRQDVLSWMGDAGVFVSGTSASDLGGALVIKTSDPAKTKRVIGVLRGLVERSGSAKVSSLNIAGVDDGFRVRSHGSPPVNVGLAGDKFIVSVASDSAFKQAISPGQPLSSSPAFTSAADKLGGGLRPAFFLDFQRVVALVGAFAGNQADFAKAKPYLDTFGAVVAGAKDEGDGVTRARFVVTLR